MEKKTRKDIVEYISDDRVATAITTVMFKKFVILGSPHISAPLSCDVHFSDLREHASFHCENGVVMISKNQVTIAVTTPEK